MADERGGFGFGGFGGEWIWIIIIIIIIICFSDNGGWFRDEPK